MGSDGGPSRGDAVQRAAERAQEVKMLRLKTTLFEKQAAAALGEQDTFTAAATEADQDGAELEGWVF